MTLSAGPVRTTLPNTLSEPKYGPWIVHNATADSVCPVPHDTWVQLMLANQTLNEAEKTMPEDPQDNCMLDWKYDGPSRIAFYRVLIEPVREVRTWIVNVANRGEKFYPAILSSTDIIGSPFTLTCHYEDGKLICGEFFRFLGEGEE